jgi:UDP-2,4-diacetamido-2,4,6-trideoxy-beta-L-altropyranose hydrolase
MSKKREIIFRVDSGSQVGHGHLMRTLVLAKQLQNFFEITYIMQTLEGNANEKVIEAGYKLQLVSSSKVDEFLPFVSRCDYLIIDNYMVCIYDEKVIKKQMQGKLVVFDDLYIPHHCDIVINHSFIANAKEYELIAPQAKALCGAPYTLLREEFLIQTIYIHPTKDNKKVLIMMGGSDPTNVTMDLIQMYNQEFTLSVLTTTSNPHLDQLKAQNVNLIINSNEVADVIKAHDIIFTAASTSLIETIACKKAFVAFKTAQNQRKTVDFLHNLGYVNVVSSMEKDAINNALAFVYENEEKMHELFSTYQFRSDAIAKELINA